MCTGTWQLRYTQAIGVEGSALVQRCQRPAAVAPLEPEDSVRAFASAHVGDRMELGSVTAS